MPSVRVRRVARRRSHRWTGWPRAAAAAYPAQRGRHVRRAWRLHRTGRAEFLKCKFMTADEASGRVGPAAEGAVDWLDERTGFARFARTAMRKVFPDHWSFLLGELALFNFVILVVTGTFLTFFFTPDTNAVIYQGEFAPLQGQQVSAAFN